MTIGRSPDGKRIRRLGWLHPVIALSLLIAVLGVLAWGARATAASTATYSITTDHRLVSMEDLVNVTLLSASGDFDDIFGISSPI
ncbi:MAG: hypothetical protein ACRD3M_06650, partial [Thermoanaerobaculia bacterium]